MKKVKLISRKKTLAVLTMGLLAAAGSQAAEHTHSGLTLTPSVGYHGHDDDKQGLDDSDTLSVAAGYQFNNPWAVELAYLKSEPDIIGLGKAVDEEQLRLDALYYFDQEGKFMPYTVIGAGESKFEYLGEKDKNSIVNAGLGMKYAFNDVVALRSDIRAVNYLDTETTQAAFNLGVSFLLGGKSTAPKVPADSDNDGVLDNLDSCPGTQANVAVDANGCPLKVDTDKDGVNDAIDQCPDTKAGAKVDAKGCYLTLTEEKTVTLRLAFANNAAEVVDPKDAQLVELAEFLKYYPETNVTIEGYTDSRGSEAYNQALSLKRAAAVATILQSLYGVDNARISTVGFGEAKPIADNATAEGRALNRRVEARVSTTVERVAQ